MSKKEEEWSKERIKAEMEDLKSAGHIRLMIALILILSGFGAISSGLIMFFSMMALASPYYTPPAEAYLAIFGPFIIGGIILILIGLFPLKSWLRKRRRYNELKTRL